MVRLRDDVTVPQPKKSDVMGSLPRTRPQRRSARRPAAAASEAGSGTTAKPAVTPAPKAKPAPKRAPGTPKAKAAKAKPKAKATAAKPKAAAKPKPRTQVRSSKPGAAGLPPRGYATPESAGEPPPSGTALVTTALQAAGELAQIGVSVAGQAAKSALSKLPRP